MKIVKWVTGFDHTKNPSKLLYPAFEEKFVGRPRDEINRALQEAEDVVKACIRRNGFKFSGEYHQYGEYGMPMFDDGSVLFCSWRHWGSIMAEAWDPDGDKGLDYMDFYMSGFVADDEIVAPKHELDFVQSFNAHEECFPPVRYEMNGKFYEGDKEIPSPFGPTNKKRK